MVAQACSSNYLEGWGRKIAWTQEAEVVVSQDLAIALQPGQQERNCLKKKVKIAYFILCISYHNKKKLNKETSYSFVVNTQSP